jgi:hypothetical protein
MNDGRCFVSEKIFETYNPITPRKNTIVPPKSHIDIITEVQPSNGPPRKTLCRARKKA